MWQTRQSGASWIRMTVDMRTHDPRGGAHRALNTTEDDEDTEKKSGPKSTQRQAPRIVINWDGCAGLRDVSQTRRGPPALFSRQSVLLLSRFVIRRYILMFDSNQPATNAEKMYVKQLHSLTTHRLHKQRMKHNHCHDRGKSHNYNLIFVCAACPQTSCGTTCCTQPN